MLSKGFTVLWGLRDPSPLDSDLAEDSPVTGCGNGQVEGRPLLWVSFPVSGLGTKYLITTGLTL